MLNIEENKKIKELNILCKELRVTPPLDVIIDLNMSDLNNNILYSNKQRAHSFTRNFWNTLFIKVTGSNHTSDGFGPGYITVKNTSGGLTTTPPTSNFFTSNAGLDSNYGIRVNSSDTSFDVNDYTGSFYSTSTLLHQAMSRSMSYDDVTHEWIVILSRIFVNNSGITRLINSTGLYNASNIVMERTVLDDTIEMVDSAMLTVNYSISMDFSAIDS